MNDYRISVLDKRLQEKVEENEALHGQLKHARETAQAALQSKERKTGLKNSDRDQKLDTEDLILLDKVSHVKDKIIIVKQRI